MNKPPLTNMEAIRAIRNRRSEMNVPPSRRAHVYIATAAEDTFTAGRPFIQKLAYASDVTIGREFDVPGAVTVVTADAKIEIPMDELVDKQAELARLNKELESCCKQLAGVEARLSNEKFTSKAPANIIEGARQNAAALKDKIALIESSIAALNA